MHRTMEQLFEELLEDRDGPFLSIYMSTEEKGPDTRKNPIRFKNLLSRAESLFSEKEVSDEARRAILQQLEPLQDDYQFWQHQSQGLALFATPAFHLYQRVPLNLDQRVNVGDRFLVTPLMPLLSQDRPFYILKLSLNQVQLLYGNRYAIEQIELPDVPESIVEAQKDEVHEKSIQFHTGTQARGEGKRGAMFHGQGTGTDDIKEQRKIREFFQLIDTGLEKVIAGSEAPLLIASDKQNISLFSDVCDYNFLHDQHIPGNPEQRSERELRDKAIELLEDHYQQEADKARKRYEKMHSDEQATHDSNRIVPAAHHAQVDTLFLNKDKELRGRFDADSNSIVLDTENSRAEDLMNAATVETLRNGGSVFVSLPESAPDSATLAAILRF